MSNINHLGAFPERIVFSTKKNLFDVGHVTFAKNIQDIANTTAKPSFIKKIFNKMERFSTLFMISQTGRMGISNRKNDVFNTNFNKYNEAVSTLKHRQNNFDLNVDNIESSKDFDLNNKGGLDNIIALKNKVIVERHKVSYFISLIENENSSFKTRYSFFNYLNELQRAEYFCRSSENIEDNQLADIFKNIIGERVERIKKEDVKKIFNEIVIKYGNEIQFKNKDKSTLANFSSNKDKEKFISKINFLVLLSEYNSSIMNQVFKQDFPKQLQNIMHAILNEEHSHQRVIFLPQQIKNTWIHKYMNEFYGEEKKITTQGMGVNTDSNIEVKNRNDDISSAYSGAYRDDMNENASGLINGLSFFSSLSDDSSRLHSRRYSNDMGDNISGLMNKGYISSADELYTTLKTEYPNLLYKDSSITPKNNLKKEIENILSKLYDLSSIVTESLSLPQSKNKELIISLEKITAISNIIHNIKEQVNNIESDYSFQLSESESESESFYSKIRGSTENIADMFSSMAEIIEHSNNKDFSFIREEIENMLKNIFGEINYSMLIGKKELLDNIMELISKFIHDSNESIEINNNDNKVDSDMGRFNYSTNSLEWDDIIDHNDFYEEQGSPSIDFKLVPEQSLEKNNIEAELKRTELNMKELNNDLEKISLNEKKLEMEKDYYNLTHLEKNE